MYRKLLTLAWTIGSRANACNDYLNRERDHLESDYSEALELIGDFAVTDNNFDVIEQVMLWRLLAGSIGHEPNRIPSRYIA